MSSLDIRSLPSGTTVEIYDDSGLDLRDEIADYLSPHYTTATHGSTVLRIHASGRVPLPTGMSEFDPEGRPGGFTAQFGVAGDRIWVHEPRTEVSTCFDFSAGRIDIYPSAGRRYAIVQSSYAAIRMIETRDVQAAGGSIVHAGAVTHSGRGLLIVGGKASGKTTLTTALLALGASYLASDRAYVFHDQIAGWPCSYRIAPSALELVLGSHVLARLRASFGHLIEDPDFSFGGKLRLPPAAFLRSAGFSAAPTAQLYAIAELDPMGASEIVERSVSLEPHLVPYHVPGQVQSTWPPTRKFLGSQWLVRGRTSPIEVARALIDRLRGCPELEAVPAWS